MLLQSKARQQQGAHSPRRQGMQGAPDSARMPACPQVREGLVPLIRAVRERGTPPDASILAGTFDTGAQAELCNSLAKELGFDLDKGRLDVSVHPFTGGTTSVPTVAS